MGTWNCRAVRREFADGHEEIGIYSVYYEGDKVDGMSVEPAPANDFSIEQLENTLELMKAALQQPILDYCGPRVTPNEFMRLPVKRAELVEGVVVELPHRMLGDSFVLGTIGGALLDFTERNRLGKVAAGGCFFTENSNVRMPAISFMSNADLVGESTDEIISKAPTLAVEMLAKNDADDIYDDKADEFLRAGSKAVWIVNPRRRTVAVHAPGASPVTFQVGETIPGSAILPDFELPVADIFED